MKALLSELETFVDDETVRAVVESPKGAAVKLAYDPALRAFVASRSLPIGVTYPYDWGFIAGTRAEDGDPVDALILHQSPTYPGIVIAARVLGMIELSETSEKKGRLTNNRVIVVPVWYDRLDDTRNADELPKQVRREIEQFFLDTVFFTAKDARIEGWRGPGATLKFIRAHRI